MSEIAAGAGRASLRRLLAMLLAFCGWLLNATRGYALKVVNPGGVEVWKQGTNGMAGLDDIVPGFGVSPRQIVAEVARTADELKLPHSAHIHCNQLGMPGNWTTTLDTMKAVDGHRGHLTHIQFHSYGGGPDDQGPAIMVFSADGKQMFGMWWNKDNTTSLGGDPSCSHNHVNAKVDNIRRPGLWQSTSPSCSASSPSRASAAV